MNVNYFSKESSIVFLDIDGVVATEAALEKMLQNYYSVKGDVWTLKALMDDSKLLKPDYRKEKFPFSQDAINNIYNLQWRTNCNFVMSSRWRIDRNLDEINELMALKGLYIQFIDKLADTQNENHAESIHFWLQARENVKNYVVIDDDDLGMDLYHKNHFVRTNPEIRFDSLALEKAIKILTDGSLRC